jgi:hypothetical protein
MLSAKRLVMDPFDIVAMLVTRLELDKFENVPSWPFILETLRLHEDMCVVDKLLHEMLENEPHIPVT